MNSQITKVSRLALLALAVTASACSTLPTSGPTQKALQAQAVAPNGIRVVDVDSSVTRDIAVRKVQKPFCDFFHAAADNGSEVVSAGDVIEVSVWEAPPAVLFAGASREAIPGMGASISPAGATTFPTQMVNGRGEIYIPFAGKIAVAGKRLADVEADIVSRLNGKANQPQVLVRLVANNNAYVTVVGEVASSTRMSLTPRNERLLDALASAGGTKQPVDKVTLQLARGQVVHALPLDSVIRDPKQNIVLQPGDVVTALFQPLSFTALGATGKSDEINFETQGISLAQALARVGGVNDSRANAGGVFIFRFETTSVTNSGGIVTEEKTPVLYRIDLRDPRAFFVAQNFPMENKDVLYVANAPAAELQKFLNLVFSTVYPLENAVSLAK